jgi:hypothetical protein
MKHGTSILGGTQAGKLRFGRCGLFASQLERFPMVPKNAIWAGGGRRINGFSRAIADGKAGSIEDFKVSIVYYQMLIRNC